jgi:DNA-binding HxlR family transcriptional regulator
MWYTLIRGTAAPRVCLMTHTRRGWRNGGAAMTLERKLVLDPDETYCPVRATLALLGQKWVPHIIHQLMGGKRRFNELAHVVGGCNSRTLRDRLRSLEELGIVHREIIATMPPWVEYELTASGRELGRALADLSAWGRAYLATPPCLD